MESFWFFIIIIIILTGPILFPFAFYFIIKKLAPRFAIATGIFTFLIISLIYINIIFEDRFYTKKDVRSELETIDLRLIDDFEITKNHSGGLMDYFHIFELSISTNDVQRLTAKEHFESQQPLIRNIDLERGEWKKAWINIDENTLTFEHVIN